MKSILLALGLLLAFAVNAQNYKVNAKTTIATFEVKIKKVEIKGNETKIYGEMKQKKRFSYNISFDDCYIKLASGERIDGSIFSWNNEKRGLSESKPVSDSNNCTFILIFPKIDFTTSSNLTLKVGTCLNREKTEVIIPDLSIQK